MGAGQSLPVGDATCRPTYIVFRRTDTGTYTPYMFETPQALGKWVFDDSIAPPVAAVAAAAPLPTPPLTTAAPPTEKKEEPEPELVPESDFHTLADIFLNSSFLQLSRAGSLPRLSLNEKEAKLLAEFVAENPDVYSPRLFKQDTLLPSLKTPAVLQNEAFRAACREMSGILASRLEASSTSDFSSFTEAFKKLNTLFQTGEHLREWNALWKGMTFEGVGVWGAETAPNILKEVLLNWCRDEKPTDAVRKFMLKVYIVQNYFIQMPGCVDQSILQIKLKEVTSSEFLSRFLKDLGDTSAKGGDAGENPTAMILPRDFASWLVNGTTYTHCKAAFAELGVEQVRKTHGQVFSNVYRKRAVKQMGGKGAPISGVGLYALFTPSVNSGVEYFNIKDIMLNAYESEEQTTSSFEGAVTGAGESSLITLDHIGKYSSLMDLYNAERDKVCAGANSGGAARGLKFREKLPPPEDETELEYQLRCHPELFPSGSVVVMESPLDKYLRERDNIDASRVKATVEKPAKAEEWTPSAETRITHVA